MSGREVEPLSAFFPSIDRNLMRDLDRHLRNNGGGDAQVSQAPAAPSQAVAATASYEQAAADRAPQLRGTSVTSYDQGQGQAASGDEAASAERPNASDILDAVDQAAASMSAMAARIHELESAHYELDAMNTQLRNKLGEIVMAQQHADTLARSEGERADRAEAIAAQHLSRAQTLEADLALALGDLRRIAEAISGTLMAPR